MCNFNPLEVVGSGSEPQLQVDKNLINKIFNLVLQGVIAWMLNEMRAKKGYRS